MEKYASPLLVLLGLIVACGSSSPTSPSSGSTGSTSSGAGGTSSTTTGFLAASGTSGTTTQSSSASTGTTSSGGGANYSCTVTSTLLHECTVYLDPTSDELATYMEQCAALDGTNGTTCSQANALGTCTTDYGDETWYADGATTAAEAQTSCDDSIGTWTPG
jgi:hypothetical protein